MNLSSSHKAIYLKLVIVSLFWGGSFIAGRHLAQHMPHFVAAFGRFVVADGLLIWYMLRDEGRLPRLRLSQVWVTLLLGVSGIFFYNYFFFAGMERVPASRAALIIATNPIMTVIAMRLLFHERWTWTRGGGVLLSLLGVSIVVTQGELGAAWGGSVGAGELFIVGAAFVWVVYSLLGRFAVSGLSALATTTYAALWGTLLLAMPAAYQVATLPFAWPDAGSWVAMIYLGALGTALAYVWYYQGIVVIGPARAAVFTNLVPVFAVLLGVLLLGEEILASTLIGGALVILGVRLTNSNPNAKTVAT